MKIKIQDKIFLEAEQDSHWLGIDEARQVDGICIAGIATCYGVVIYSKEKMGACHMSSIAFGENFIQEMVDYVKNDKDLKVGVFLLRSEYGYNCIPDDDEDDEYDDKPNQSAKEFFAQQDREYIEYFKENFQIKPKIFNILHPFFSITLNRQLKTYKDHASGTIDYFEEHSESDVPTDASGPEKKTSSLSSPDVLGFFSNPAPSQKRFREEEPELSQDSSTTQLR